jgi:23S rRNA pseudouridine2605 synthase
VARKLEHPTTGWTRRYRVRIHGKISQETLDNLANGITIDGISYGPIKADLEREKGANAWVNIAIKEGKNREIRRIMEHFGLSVTRLIRVAYGPFQLGQLARGEIEEVSPRVLVEQLGIGKAPATLPKKEKPQRAHRRRMS